MALDKGTAFKQDFTQIVGNPVRRASVTLAQVAQPNVCCFGMPALAETVFTSVDNNDKFSELTFWNNAFVSASMVLQKFVGGAWTNHVALVDDTYGTFSAFGFHTTIYSEKAAGYLLDWSKVLTIEGVGRYRMKTTGTTFDSIQVIELSLDFCLEEWTEAKAEGTVRVDWYLSSIIGDQDDDTHKKDYSGLNWFNELRFNESMFGSDTGEITKKNTRYQNGSLVWTEKSQVPQYILELQPLLFDVRRIIQVNMIHADQIFISDFNANNPNPHTERSVTIAGNFEPEYTKGVEKAPVSITFEQAIQNYVNKRC